MTLIVAGTFRLPPENLDRFRAEMGDMVQSTRAEEGCLEYSYAEDALEPGLIRVFEIWRDDTALDDHLVSAHMSRWRAAWPEFGVTERRLSAYDVQGERII
jgi:quinol monooxygenase YgiN